MTMSREDIFDPAGLPAEGAISFAEREPTLTISRTHPKDNQIPEDPATNLLWYPPEVLAICHLRNSCRRTNHCVAKVGFDSGAIFKVGIQFSGEWLKLLGGTVVAWQVSSHFRSSSGRDNSQKNVARSSSWMRRCSGIEFGNGRDYKTGKSRVARCDKVIVSSDRDP